MARARAYIRYAQAHPGLYGLMFRTERLDMKRPSLDQAASAAFAELVGAVGASRHEQISEQALSLDQAAAIAVPGVWFTALRCCCSMAGFPTFSSDCLKGTGVETLLDAMLRAPVGRLGA